MINDKKNHHFLSRAEQKMNSFTTTSKAKKQRINSFKVLRSSSALKLGKAKSCTINDNLREFDLYTFDVIDNKTRRNLEGLFEKYEDVITDYSARIVEKISCKDNDMAEELIVVFAAKLMNGVRNPYCIKNTLITFKHLVGFSPVNEEANIHYNKIKEKKFPAERYLLKKYGVTKDEFTDWLKILFVLLTPDVNGINYLDLLVCILIGNQESAIDVTVFQYNGEYLDKNVLLSDTSYTLNTESNLHVIYQFNLNSNCHIAYAFTNFEKLVERFSKGKLEFNNDMCSFLKNEKLKHQNVTVHHKLNELEYLSSYNFECVEQACERVFCKSKKVYGL